MDLPTLASTLQKQIDAGGAITIDDATLGTTNVNALIQNSPLQAQSIQVKTSQQIPPPGNVLTVSGTSSFLSAQNMTTSVAFQAVNGQIQFTLTAQWPSGWSIVQSFSQAAGSSFEDLALSSPSFIFTNATVAGDDKTVGLSPGLNLSGGVGLTGLYDIAFQFFKNLVQPSALILQGTAGMSAHGPTLDLRALLSTEASIGPISLHGGYVGGRLDYVEVTYEDDSVESDDPPPAPEWVANAELVIGAIVTVGGRDINLWAILTGGWMLTFNAEADNGIANLSDLIALFGAGDWQNLLPQTLQELGGFGLRSVSTAINLKPTSAQNAVAYIQATVGISDWHVLNNEIDIQQLQATWQVIMPLNSSLRNWSITIEAEAALGPKKDIIFDLGIEVPALQIQGTLRLSDAQFTLAQLSQDLFNSQLSIPQDLLTFSVFSLGIVISPKSNLYSISAYGSIALNIFGETALGLEDTLVEATYHSDTGKAEGMLGGRLILGGYPFDISATFGQNYTFNGSLPTANPISITQFLSNLTGTSITLPSQIPELSITALTIALASADKSVSMAGTIDAKWSVPLGATNPEVEVSFAVDSKLENNVRTYSGMLKASLNIGQVFAISYTYGQNVSLIAGSWQAQSNESLDYTALGSALGIDTSVVTAPVGGQMPSLGLKSAEVQIDLANETLLFDAVSSSFGEAFVFVGKQNGSWGFVFGVALPDNWQFSQLPGSLGQDLKSLDFVTFQNAVFAVATQAQDFSNSNFPPLAKNKLSVIPGLTFGAEIDFSDPSNNGTLAKNLNTVIATEKLFIQGAIGPNLADIFIKASLQGPPIAIPPSKDLTLSQPFVIVYPDPAAFVLAVGGSLTFPVQNQSVVLTGKLQITETTASFVLNADFAKPGMKSPVGFAGVSLIDIGAEIGLNFIEMGLSLGLLAKFQLGETNPTDDEFAFQFDVDADGLVDPQLLLVKIQELDLKTIFDAVVPGVTLPSELATGIQLTNFFIYWCDQPTNLPDGTQATPGFGFNGAVDIFDVFDAQAMLKIDATSGIQGDFEMSPISVTAGDFTVLSLKGDSPQGGPKIAFNTKSSPYLDVGVDVDLMGLQQSYNALLTNTGFSFEVKYQFFGVAEFDIKAQLVNLKDFSASCDLTFDLNVKVGPVYIPDTQIPIIPSVNINGPGASLGFTLTVNPTVIFDLSGHVSVYWSSSSGGSNLSFSFDISLADIEAGLSHLYDALISWMENNAEKVLAQFLDNVWDWVKGIVDDLFEMPAIEDLIQIIKDFFSITDWQDAAKVLRELDFGIEEIAKLLEDYWNKATDGDVWDFLSSLFGICAIGTVAGLMVGAVAIPQGRQVLVDLAQTRGGQPLLLHYYTHSAEIENLLRSNRALQQRFRDISTQAAQAQGKFMPAALEAIQAVAEAGSPALKASLAEVLPLLEPYQDLTYPEFLAALGQWQPNG